MTNNRLSLHFIRHGETYFNLYDRVQGWGDSPLTERGIADAVRSGRGLKGQRFDAIYTSDLTRTEATAKIILEVNEKSNPEQKIIMMPEFREVFFGSFEGGFNYDAFMAVADYLGYETKEDLLANVHASERMDVFNKIDPHGHAETFEQFSTRLERGLNKIIANHEDTDEDILIVAHGGTIHLLVEKIIPDFIEPQPLLNASISTVHYQNKKFQLECYGDISHFAPEAD